MKIVFLLLSLFSIVSIAYAAPIRIIDPRLQTTPLPDATLEQPLSTERRANGDDEEQVGSGSGDDVDTVEEGDPANDEDPEAVEDANDNTPASEVKY